MLKRGERAEPCYREEGGQGVQVSPGPGQVGQTQTRQKDEGEHQTAQTQREKGGHLLLEADWFYCEFPSQSYFLSPAELMLLKVLAVIANYEIPANIEK